MSSPWWIWWFAISTRFAIHVSTIGPSSLPRPINGAAIGYDHTTNLIWIIGQYSSLISFNVSIWNDTNPFVDHGYPLSYSFTTYGQSYVQVGDIVYAVGETGAPIYAYDILTQNVNPITSNASTVELSRSGCLASIEDWIIYTYSTNTYILTISTQLWKLSGNPIMQRKD